jgi:hypothetical protein
MADSADTFLGVVTSLAVITAIVAGANGGVAPTSGTSVSNRTTTNTSRVTAASNQSTNIPNGTLFSCSGQRISTDTVNAGGGALTLEVFYSPVNGGRNCAVVTKTGTAVNRPGQLVTTLQFHSYDGRKWPRYAIARSVPNATRAGGVYLDNTDDKCVRAWARFLPAGGGKTITVKSGKVGCR